MVPQSIFPASAFACLQSVFTTIANVILKHKSDHIPFLLMVSPTLLPVAPGLPDSLWLPCCFYTLLSMPLYLLLSVFVFLFLQKLITSGSLTHLFYVTFSVTPSLNTPSKMSTPQVLHFSSLLYFSSN